MNQKEIMSAEIIDNEELIIQTPLSDYKVENVKVPDFASMVPEMEMADDEEVDDDSFQTLEQLGYFSPIRGMVNIQNAFDNKLYARLYRNEVQRQFFEFCQKYKSGRYSPIFQIPQSDMMIAARYNFLSKGIEEPVVRSRVAKFLMSVCDEYYSKFTGDVEELLDVTKVMSVLYTLRSKLPVYEEDQDTMSAVDLYKLIEHFTPDLETAKLFEHRSYYILDDEGIVNLAHKMGMKKRELLKQLKKHGFLYLTKSSRGYQTNARFDKGDGTTFTEWVYCIYKLRFMAGLKELERKELDLDF